jgi:tryptophan 2,3-dioxygenase
VDPDAEDFSQPVLAGGAPSDYERYLRTDDLLALQKSADEQAHRDELLFQTVHQASELWLKLAWTEAEEATKLIGEGDFAGAQRLLRRSCLALDYVIGQLEMLEALSPWEYQEIRKVLGHGSGFDSPGWRTLRVALPRLGQAFHARRRKEGLSLVDLYVGRRDNDALFRVAESMIEVDEWCQAWRVRHYRVVARLIGDGVVGTQGTPVEVLGRLVQTVFFPDLWEVRNELTARSKAEA